MHTATPQEVTPLWLRFPEAERYSGLGRTTLTKLIDTGEIKAAKGGKVVAMAIVLALAAGPALALLIVDVPEEVATNAAPKAQFEAKIKEGQLPGTCIVAVPGPREKEGPVD
jgi:hypothetical protein